ncbi:MAG TPA: gamma-glutamyl-gamma-aminobutyrate hydrolase family protein [Actinomycetota bacterium]|nr:gamma-glutamyl-gamma-aminobutyrate hydrolase family protein [Actinomycetota bacterium]
MGAPLIAIPAQRLAAGRVTHWDTEAFAVPEPYVAALRRAGGRAAIVAAPDDAEPSEILAPFDGLLLLGGGDVEPSRYGGPAHAEIYGVEPDRDELEIRLLREADRLGMPALCICRGIQVLNVAFGGSLLAHLPDVPGLGEHRGASYGQAVTHEVKLQPGSRLALATGREVLTCSSHHHQGLDRLGEGLVAVGWSGDGLVEAVERDRGWIVGVQWHPEETADRDPAQQALFDALVEHARRPPGGS